MKRSILFVLLLAIFQYAMAGDARCEYNRPSIVACLFKNVDVNHDGSMTKKEIHASVDSRLGWWKRQLFNTMGGANMVMNKCDANKDGRVSRDDLQKTRMVCLSDCTMLTTIADVFKCDPHIML